MKNGVNAVTSLEENLSSRRDDSLKLPKIYPRDINEKESIKKQEEKIWDFLKNKLTKTKTRRFVFFISFFILMFGLVSGIVMGVLNTIGFSFYLNLFT